MGRAIVVVAVAGAAMLAGCSVEREARVVRAAEVSEQRALLDRVKGLEGEWVMEGPDGEQAVTVFKVSSAGSVVREVMFPGSNHEMTNVYHMDGPELVMTHYCAAGNQPRMRAAAEGEAIHFRFDDVTNLRGAEETYMGEMVLTLIDEDHFRQDWWHFIGGVRQEPPAQFVFARKR